MIAKPFCEAQLLCITALRILAIAVALLFGTSSHAERFLPTGAFSYEDIRLANGLRIVVQRVHTAPYISARLVVKTGTDHYPCNDRELPHLVEHLLFSANSVLAESDIDDQINAWGGQINAFTYAEQTEVVLDAHARFQVPAMQLLATMIGNFDPQPADVVREADVVERESGADHTALRLWWTQQPFVQRASTKFELAAGITCTSGLTPIHHLAEADIRQAFDTYYVPANMILVLVGDLDEAGLAAAKQAFGALPARPAPVVTPLPITMPATTDFTSGWLSGTASLDAPTAAGIAPFHDWEGFYALQLVESWLNNRMFRELRSERGIAYTPSASVAYHGTATLVTLAAETSPKDTAYTRDYLRALVTRVQTQGIPEEDFQNLRTAALLGMAQEFERISDRANYLSGSVREIENGGLFDIETFYAQLSYSRFYELVRRDWPPHFVVLDASPRVSWSAWIGLLGGSTLLLMLGVGLLVWRRLRALRPG